MRNKKKNRPASEQPERGDHYWGALRIVMKKIDEAYTVATMGTSSSDREALLGALVHWACARVTEGMTAEERSMRLAVMANVLNGGPPPPIEPPAPLAPAPTADRRYSPERLKAAQEQFSAVMAELRKCLTSVNSTPPGR